jgi:cation diffusion facilitator CzcD-associated flavoprotein CzcO
VGESFRLWPEEMRFISPSFNQQGCTNSFDLNAVSYGTSPAYSLHTEHPSGHEYADYLSAMAKTNELNIRNRTEVVSVTPGPENENVLSLFDVKLRTKHDDDDEVTESTLSAQYVVWAAGEFQYPKAATKKPETDDDDFPGAHLCLHNSRVKSWASLPGDDLLIIGGYESGADAAV